MIQQTPHLLGMQMEELTSRVTAKTLVICGEQDPIVPLEWGRQLASSFTHGTFVTVPGPHATMFAAPDLIAGHVDRHAHL
jgi:pimeloyl-ACP methyl ester carboxylesterase